MRRNVGHHLVAASGRRPTRPAALPARPRTGDPCPAGHGDDPRPRRTPGEHRRRRAGS
ncbi:MAG: hypothetical protein AVDCRST_MAG07-2201 [uncultured Frankineae bacterium]|uniref:Uncharacterized protein n=1 Tax=uncultured Frankineae bacterium TaxID=437475 RepID=A0A6J4LTX7_9ACTN|nr:MAG: hypothetical protein AVDCRST_MAG07-2201 [uncultured Frankineae bacterium]